MKRIHSVLGILLFTSVTLIACNADPAKEGTSDTSATTIDSMQPVTTPADSANVLPDTMPKNTP